jgi:hypothetical protein
VRMSERAGRARGTHQRLFLEATVAQWPPFGSGYTDNVGGVWWPQWVSVEVVLARADSGWSWTEGGAQ